LLLDLINHPVCVWLRELTIYGKLIRKEEIQAGILNGVVALISWDNERGETADFIGFYVGAHNVYYVKYGGFALKFMSPSLSGTYR